MFARDKRFWGCSETVLIARRNASAARAGRLSTAGTSSPQRPVRRLLTTGIARVARATTQMFTLRMFAGCPVYRLAAS